MGKIGMRKQFRGNAKMKIIILKLTFISGKPQRFNHQQSLKQEVLVIHKYNISKKLSIYRY